MSNTDDMATVARLRRAMPRNSDVMRVCDIAERALIAKPSAVKSSAPRFDKKAYQREYMRRYRAHP